MLDFALKDVQNVLWNDRTKDDRRPGRLTADSVIKLHTLKSYYELQGPLVAST